MLRQLLLVLILAGGAYLAWRARRWLQARTVPGIPDDWRALAAKAPALAEAIDLRDRLGRVIESDDPLVQRTLMLDVHAILAEVVELVRLRREVEHHLHTLQTRPAGRRPGRPLPVDLERQRMETRAALEARADRFAGETARAVSSLRQVYLELLEVRETGSTGGKAAINKTQALIETLRAQAAAEREIDQYLRKGRESE